MRPAGDVGPEHQQFGYDDGHLLELVRDVSPELTELNQTPLAHGDREYGGAADRAVRACRWRTQSRSTRRTTLSFAFRSI